MLLLLLHDCFKQLRKILNNYVQVGVEVPEFLGECGSGGDAGGDDDEDWG